MATATDDEMDRRGMTREQFLDLVTDEDFPKGTSLGVLLAHEESLRVKLAAAEARCAELRGAMDADDRRLREAAIRVWGEDRHGCDTPDWMAELILSLRARCADLEAERDCFRERLDQFEAYAITVKSALDDRDRVRELQEELRLTLIASHVHADEHRQQRARAARYEAALREIAGRVCEWTDARMCADVTDIAAQVCSSCIARAALAGGGK